jgi:hypothetical protein
MITDKLLRVSEDQVLTLNATSAVSTNTIDLSQNRDIGEGEELYFNFAITTAVASAATSVTFEIIASDAADLGTPTVLASTGAIGYASLTLGTNIALPIPPRVGSLGQRYIGARYTTAGNNSSGAGKVTTDVVMDIQDGKKFYPSGFSVV